MRLRLLGALAIASLATLCTVACGSSSSSSASGITGPQIMPAANTDPDACAPPAGFACCDVEFEGTWTCGADGGTVCQSGTSLQSLDNCTVGVNTGDDAATDAPSTTSDAGGTAVDASTD